MKTTIPLRFGEKHQPDFAFSRQAGDLRFYSKIHWHDAFEIILVKQGKLRISIQKNWEYIYEGDIAILPSGTLHGTDSREGFCEFNTFSYTESLIYSPEISIFNMKYLSIFKRDREGYRILRSGEPGAEGLKSLLLSAMEEYLSEGFDRELKVRAAILGIHGAICSVYLEDGAQAERTSERLAEAELFIESHLSEDISPSDVAAAMHLSYSHLSRLVTSALGYSLGELIARMKMNWAERLMTEYPAESITAIAMRCGYNSASYFTRTFKKMKGTTPLSYRKMLNGTKAHIEADSEYKPEN